jgi:tetratricopeptide (TPR) repeat protein
MKIHLLPEVPDIFVGRTEQLQKLRHNLSTRRLIFIEGVIGIGKTTLALALGRYLEMEKPGHVYWISCKEGWNADVLHREIKNWLPAEMKKKYGVWDERESHTISEKFLSLVNMLNHLEATVFVDDLHLLSCSYFIDIIRILKTYLNKSRFCLITRERPLLPFIDKADIFEERLGGLTESESSALIEKLLNQRNEIKKLPESLRRKMVKKLEGHPLLIKTLASLLMEGIMTAGDFTHRQPECLEEIVDDLIVEMTKDLSSDEMYILKLCSMSRVPLSQDVAAPPSLFDRLKRHFILTVDMEGKICPNALVKHYINQQINNDERLVLHERLAEYHVSCLSGSEEMNDTVREILYHFAGAGKIKEAREVFLAHADSMYTQGYYEDIIFYTQIFPLSDISLMTLRADVLSILGHPGEAADLLKRVTGHITDEKTMASIYYSLARASSRKGNFNEVDSYCDKAFQLFRKYDDTGGIVDMLNTKAMLSSYGLNMKAAYAFNNEALLIATGASDRIGIARSLHVKSILSLEDGRYAESAELSALCIEKASTLNAHLFAGRAMIYRGMALSHLGCYGEAGRCLDSGFEYASESLDIQLEALYLRSRSLLHGEQNALPEALAEIEMSMDLFFIGGNRLSHDSASLMKASFLIELDRFDEAEVLLLKIASSPASAEVLRLAVEIRLSLAQIYLETMAEIEETVHLMGKNIEALSHLRDEERLGESYLKMAEALWHLGERQKMENCLAHALLIGQQSESSFLTACVLYLSGFAARKPRKMKQEYIADANAALQKLKGSRERLAESFFRKIDAAVSIGYSITIGEYCFHAMEAEVELIRMHRKDFSLFVDLPRREIHEKEKGIIDMLNRKIVTSLMLFLMKNPGRCFSYEEIFTEVWGYEYDSEASDGEVRKTISRLRELIEPNSTQYRYVKLNKGYKRRKGEYFFTTSESFCLIERCEIQREHR